VDDDELLGTAFVGWDGDGFSKYCGEFALVVCTRLEQCRRAGVVDDGLLGTAFVDGDGDGSVELNMR